MLSLIAALSKNYVIGHDNQLPWHLPADLKHFKALTLHKPVIMGRNTFESIGRPLPKRRNIIVSRQTNLIIPACEVYASIDEALQATQNEPETIIIGGATLYEQTISKADMLYLTIIDTELKGDAYFPRAWSRDDWNTVQEEFHTKNAENPFNYTFLTLQKKT